MPTSPNHQFYGKLAQSYNPPHHHRTLVALNPLYPAPQSGGLRVWHDTGQFVAAQLVHDALIGDVNNIILQLHVHAQKS